LLFNDAPKALVEKIEQVVRLIRSKGVGVYFITQNPIDIPEEIAGQLGNRVQHALRAFTPRDQRAIRAAIAKKPHLPLSGGLLGGIGVEGKPDDVSMNCLTACRMTHEIEASRARAILLSA
jgi:DNA helicase HerA-like ATPase